MGISGQLHAAAALLAGKQTFRYLLARPGRPQRRSVRCGV
jgi:hypothetical protein